MRPCLNLKSKKKTEDVAKQVEHLLSIHKALDIDTHMNIHIYVFVYIHIYMHTR